jgi:hypothetical protein
MARYLVKHSDKSIFNFTVNSFHRKYMRILLEDINGKFERGYNFISTIERVSWHESNDDNWLNIATYKNLTVKKQLFHIGLLMGWHSHIHNILVDK